MSKQADFEMSQAPADNSRLLEWRIRIWAWITRQLFRVAQKTEQRQRELWRRRMGRGHVDA